MQHKTLTNHRLYFAALTFNINFTTSEQTPLFWSARFPDLV